MNFKDCYHKLENNRLTVGNSLIEREYLIVNDGLYPVLIKDVAREYSWSCENRLSAVNTPVSLENFSLYSDVANNNGLSNEFLKITLQAKKESLTQSFVWEIYPSSPLITFYYELNSEVEFSNDTELVTVKTNTTGVELSDNQPRINSQKDVIDCIAMGEKHYKLSTVKLYDKTDGNNELVSETEESYYHRRPYAKTGNMFIVEDYLSNNAILIVKESPTHSSSLSHCRDFTIDSNSILRVVGSGIDSFSGTVISYGTTVCVNNKEYLLEAYKEHYKNVWHKRVPLIISNTWGDRSQDAAVNEKFILKEIEHAAYLGVDSVMIDDGWQKGITANSKLKSGGVWEGYYSDSEDFWSVNQTKFPQGLKPLVDSACEKGITISLWFSPDSSSDFKNWEKDVNAILNLHNKYKISHFKLDGVKIRNKLSEYRYLRFMEKVYDLTNGKVELVQDITAEDRLGYLYHKQYGILFVENRYTDFRNYYPHHTLKNIWILSKYFPTTKMHMELLNNTRNAELYADDLLAPKNYDIDYLFASVMVSNPLMWMELQHLPSKETLMLKKIISVYKKHRENFKDAAISPIGQKPDGNSFTGFNIKLYDNTGYLILFREFVEQNDFVFDVKEVSEITKYKILASNDNIAEVETADKGKLRASFCKKGAYVFARYA